jgi:DNA-binding NarL/FixJ family response regulator
METMANILIVDDHSLIRDGIKGYLKDSPYKVIGEASNGRQAIEMVESLHPEVIIMDISMPVVNGMEASKIILQKWPETKIIVLSMHLEQEFIESCMEVGISAYLFKSAGKSEVIDAIESVLIGSTFYSNEVREKVMNIFTNTLKKKKSQLKEEPIIITNREKEVIRLVMDGKTSAEIAEILFISPRTVDTHRSNLMQKLQTKNTVELIRKVNELDLLD